MGGAQEFIHISRVGRIVEDEKDTPLFASQAEDPSDVEKKIAENVMSYIHDGICP